MSDRSELLKRILQIWDYSEEGRRYLDWLLEPEAANLDGGAVLREAVLDLMEDDEQLRGLRQEKAAAELEELYAQLPPETAVELRQHTKGLPKSRSQQENSFRLVAAAVRDIRHSLRIDRLEALGIVSQILESAPDPEEPFNKVFSVLKSMPIAERVAASIAARSRTSMEKIDIEAEWRARSGEDSWAAQTIQDIANDPGEYGFDRHREKFDCHYSQQLVLKLDNIIERIASLAPVNLDAQDHSIRRLFREAHEAFLYGFDAASIALSRSLVEHALRDKLSLPHGDRSSLQSMIKQARSQKLLADSECDSAERVRLGGDKIMHDIPNVRSTAAEVLDSTRTVLNKLYGCVASAGAI